MGISGLTDKELKALQPDSKNYTRFDTQGLFLFVTPKGHKSWRLKYRLDGKEYRLVLGAYPEMSLRAARDLRDDVRSVVKKGRKPDFRNGKVVRADPNDEGETFEQVAREWYTQQCARWKPVHANGVITSLERDLFPDLGSMPIRNINERLSVSKA